MGRYSGVFVILLEYFTADLWNEESSCDSDCSAEEADCTKDEGSEVYLNSVKSKVETEVCSEKAKVKSGIVVYDVCVGTECGVCAIDEHAYLYLRESVVASVVTGVGSGPSSGTSALCCRVWCGCGG